MFTGDGVVWYICCIYINLSYAYVTEGLNYLCLISVDIFLLELRASTCISISEFTLISSILAAIVFFEIVPSFWINYLEVYELSIGTGITAFTDCSPYILWFDKLRWTILAWSSLTLVSIFLTLSHVATTLLCGACSNVYTNSFTLWYICSISSKASFENLVSRSKKANWVSMHSEYCYMKAVSL